MSLSRATTADGAPLDLPGDAPYPAEQLQPLRGVPLVFRCEDPWLQAQGDEAHAYLDGARRGWSEFPEWMDVADVGSPAYDLKTAERDLYLYWWRDWLDSDRVLDVGCGVGRMLAAFLDRGATVIGVDGDAQSLQHAAWHAGGRPGKVDLHWSSVHRLPPGGDFDAVISCEVLCYVPDVEPVVASIFDKLRPGGAFLVSLEARWGWATSEDAPPGSLDEALEGTGILHEPGERWVRTYEQQDVVDLLMQAGFEVQHVVPLFYITDGPLERTLPPSASLEQLLAYEERCRAHPVWGRLNRMWAAVAIKPG